MVIADSNAIIRSYLTTASPAVNPLIALIGERVYCPRLPENATLPAVGFFTRGGESTPYIPGIITPSVQFDCWADNPIDAREVYRALYDALQGIQQVTVGAYAILSAIEEVQGQDLVDDSGSGIGGAGIPNYFRTLTFFRIMIRAE